MWSSLFFIWSFGFYVLFTSAAWEVKFAGESETARWSRLQTAFCFSAVFLFVFTTFESRDVIKSFRGSNALTYCTYAAIKHKGRSKQKFSTRTWSVLIVWVKTVLMKMYWPVNTLQLFHSDSVLRRRVVSDLAAAELKHRPVPDWINCQCVFVSRPSTCVQLNSLQEVKNRPLLVPPQCGGAWSCGTKEEEASSSSSSSSFSHPAGSRNHVALGSFGFTLPLSLSLCVCLPLFVKRSLSCGVLGDA